MKKTFKIGEYAIGGIITVDITDDNIIIRALDYNTKEEVRSQKFDVFTYFIETQLREFLLDLTSYYFADKVLEFIKSKISLKNEFNY